jgi:hypothetical protein
MEIDFFLLEKKISSQKGEKMNRCYWYDMSREAVQRDKPRTTYEAKGCFQCEGDNETCPAYFPRKIDDGSRSKEWPYEVLDE